METSHRARIAVDSGETPCGDMREEIAAGNALEGNPGSHGDGRILLSYAPGVEPSQ